jgi:hypothetical protein
MADMFTGVYDAYISVVGALFHGIKPSSYYWCFPRVLTPMALDELSLTPQLMTLDQVMPRAILWCGILSLIRYVLMKLFLEEAAMKLMNFKLLDITKKTSKATQAINAAHNAAVQKRVTKFIEAAWRFIFYLTFLIVGYGALCPNGECHEWIFNTKNCWEGWPYHVVTEEIKFLYIIEFGAYFHQLLWTEVKRDDAVEMIVHHCVTIALIGFSFCCNYMLIGSMIMVCHTETLTAPHTNDPL